VVVVDTVALAVASCLGLSVDIELARDSRTVTITDYTLATTIDVLFIELLGTYRSELRCMVVKARRCGCSWLICWAEEPWPPSCGGSLVSSSAVLTLGVGPTGGV
jgi:hypothetical protein